MAKRKLQRFAEMETFQHVIQPPLDDVFQKDHPLKGNWNERFFKNNNPIVLELGCGKGEYTTGLAEKFPGKNFIGIDIKGARIWKGAKYAHEKQLLNVGFLRIRIDFIGSFFASNEVSEIWITFPDPQLKKTRKKKRLTSSVFLSRYREFLKEDGPVHLKTDNTILYEYTRQMCLTNHLNIQFQTDNLYQSMADDQLLSIKTFYESQFLAQGIPIKYLRFRIPGNIQKIEEPEDENEG